MLVMNQDKLLTSKDVLEILKIGRTKLFRLINQGVLNPVRIGDKKEGAKKGPSLKFRKSDIDNLLK